MRKSATVAAAAIFVVVLAGLGVAGMPMAENYLATRIKAEVEAAGVLAVGAVEVGLLDRRVTLLDVHSKQIGGVTAGRWEASGLAWPIGELLRGHSPLAGLRLGDPFQARHLEFRDLRVALPGGQEWKVGTIAMDGLDLGRFDADVPPSAFQTAALTARMANVLSLDRLEERDVVYSDPATQSTARFVDLVAERVVHGSLGALAFTDLAISTKDAPTPSFTLADLKTREVDLRQPLVALSEASWRPGIPVGRLAVGWLSATGFGGEVFKRYGLSPGRITLQTTRNGEVRHSNALVEDFVFAPPSGRQGLQTRIVMSAMGLKELRLGLDCSGTEDRGKAELAVDRCALSGPELGKLDLSARFVQADDMLWRAIDSGDARMLFGTKLALGSATMAFTDKGMLDHVIRALSAANAQSLETTRSNVAQEIRRYQPPGVLITDDMTKILDTVARFIEQGGTLTVETKPDPPFELGQLASLQRIGADVVGLLGLSARLSH
jgi:hypothetical protein